MRSLKTSGSLTHGSGRNEEQRSLWTMSMQVTAMYNIAMQDLNNLTYTTSGQHKETTDARPNKDIHDLAKITSRLIPFTPFSEDRSLLLPDLSTISGSLYHLTEKSTKWKWDQPQEDAFKKLKQMLTDNTVLAHFDPSCPVGISCDAPDAGVGAVLFHRYKDNTERPIANASKPLTATQKRYPVLSTNPEGSSIHHLRTEEISSILIRQEVHPCDRPQAIGFHVWTKYCHTSISS